MNAVHSDNRPVGVPFPLGDHEDTAARDCLDIPVNINDEVDRWADIRD